MAILVAPRLGWLAVAGCLVIAASRVMVSAHYPERRHCRPGRSAAASRGSMPSALARAGSASTSSLTVRVVARTHCDPCGPGRAAMVGRPMGRRSRGRSQPAQIPPSRSAIRSSGSSRPICRRKSGPSACQVVALRIDCGRARVARLSKPPHDAPMPNSSRPSMKRLASILAPAGEDEAEQPAGAGHVALPERVAGIARAAPDRGRARLRAARRARRRRLPPTASGVRGGRPASAGREGRGRCRRGRHAGPCCRGSP